MSLLGTLAKVAIGVAVAKGVSSMAKGATAAPRGGAGSGSVFGGANSPSRGQQQGGLEDMLGQILGGKQAPAQQGGGLGGMFGGQQTSQQGGLGGLLEQLAKGGTAPTTRSAAPQQGGSLGDLLGGLLGGAAAGGAASGGLGDLLGQLAGKGAAPSNNRGFGDMLNDAFANKGEPEVAPTAEQNAMAGLMLKAMIQAAKADGKIDENEKQKLLGNLGEIDAEEQAFVKREMQAPVDVAGLARLVPKGLEQQVYLMSLMAIDLDSQNEARYLHELATAMRLNQQTVNAIHAQAGVPALYA